MLDNTCKIRVQRIHLRLSTVFLKEKNFEIAQIYTRLQALPRDVLNGGVERVKR